MRILLILTALLLPGLAAAQVYRWVDDQGVVHYSDQRRTGAERADLPKLQSAKPPPDTGDEEQAPVQPGQAPGLTLTQPAPEATFHDGRGLVPVTVAVDTPLTPAHSLVYYLDGQPSGSPTRATSVQLKGVARGEHRVSVALMRGEDELARTAPVTFYVQSPSAVKPPSGSGEQPTGAPTSPATPQAGGAPGAPRFNTGQ